MDSRPGLASLPTLYDKASERIRQWRVEIYSESILATKSTRLRTNAGRLHVAAAVMPLPQPCNHGCYQ